MNQSSTYTTHAHFQYIMNPHHWRARHLRW